MKLATGAALFVLGVAAAFGTGVTLDGTLLQAGFIVVGTSLVVSVLFQVRNRTRFVFALAVLFLLVGFARGASVETEPGWGWSNVPGDGERVTLRAWLTDDADRAGSGVRLSLSAISVNGEPAEFPLTVFSRGLSDLTDSGRASGGFRYGDVYSFSGRFSVSTGRFAESSAGTVFTGIVNLESADRGNHV